MAANSADGSQAAAPEASLRRRTRLSVGEGHTVLAIPPAGLGLHELGHLLVLWVGGALLVAAGERTPTGGALFSLRYLMVIGGVFLVAAGLYRALGRLMNQTTVRLSKDVVEVGRSFPISQRRAMGRKEFTGAVIGRQRLVAQGYVCHNWGAGAAELVVRGGRRTLHFGEGLSAEELAWLKGMVDKTLGPAAPPSMDVELEEEDETIQPPEKFWSDVARYSAYCLLGSLVLFGVLVVLDAGGESLLTAAFLVGDATGVAGLGYRNYRLGMAASRWHRAVIRYMAATSGLRFSSADRAEVGQRLPDFPFFYGPRRFYNVVWSIESQHKIMGFDFSSGGLTVRRDGVGCALPVEGLSRDTVSIKPRRLGGARFQIGGIKLPEYPELTRAYRITAENRGRARILLGPQVVAAITSWKGQGPPPWVCVQDGVLGLRIERKHADSHRSMRYFYSYARRLRQLVEDHVRHLRAAQEAAKKSPEQPRRGVGGSAS